MDNRPHWHRKFFRTLEKHAVIVHFFCPSPLPFGGSTVLSLTRGLAGNRTTNGSLLATQVPRYQLSREDD